MGKKIKKNIELRKKDAVKKEIIKKKTTGKKLSLRNKNQLLVEETAGNHTKMEQTKMSKGNIYIKSKFRSRIKGQFYEIKLIMLFVIRAIMSGYKFKLASQMDMVGAFDDIVMNIYVDVLTKKSVFLQVKHTEKTKISGLDKVQGDYSLFKYFKSYMNILSNKNELLKEGFDVNKAEFIIYTNTYFKKKSMRFLTSLIKASAVIERLATKNLTAYKIKEEMFDEIFNIFQNFANPKNKTSKAEESEPKKKKAKFAENKNVIKKLEVDEYLKKVTFLVSQGNVSEVEILIKENISLRFDEHNKEAIDDVYLKSFKDYQTWWQKEDCVEYLNQKDDFFRAHSSVCLSHNLYFLETQIKNNISSKCIEFKDSNLVCFKKDISQAGSVLLHAIPGAGMLTVAKVLQTYKKNKDIMYIDSMFVEQYNERIECNFSKSRNINTLVYHVGVISQAKQFLIKILKIVKENCNKRVIVICDEQIDCKILLSLQDNTRYCDLSSGAQEQVSNSNITFQGREMHVKDVLGECEKLGDDLLAKLLLQEPVIIASGQFENLKELHYISRKFQKHLLHFDILDKCKNDVLLIQASENDCRHKLCRAREVRFYPEFDLKRKNLYFFLQSMDNLKLFKAFQALCENHDNVHLLECTNDQLCWVQSNGSVKLIMEHVEGYKVLTESDIVDCCYKDKLVVISDVAGMGKSTVLKSLANKVYLQYPSLWILKINLSKHQDVLHKIKTTTNSKDVCQVLLNTLTYFSESEKTFLLSMLAAGKVAVFLDGFDEISPDYEQIVLDFVKELQNSNVQQLYLTTRPQMKGYIQENLHTLSYTFVALDTVEQVNYVSSEWIRKEKSFAPEKEALMKCCAQKLIAKITSISSKQDIAICGIPLQLKMIVEIYPTFNEGKKILENNEILITLEHLYDKFLQRKIHIYCKEKLGYFLSNVLYKREFDTHYDTSVLEHQLIAVDMICSDFNYDLFLSEEDETKLVQLYKKEDVITRYGIVSAVHPRNSVFIHRTFAEYFSATFICSIRKCKKITNIFVTEILIKSNYQVTRKFLNGMINKLNVNRPLSTEENLLMSIHVAAKEENIKLLKFLLQDLRPESESTKIILNTYDKGYTVLQRIVKSSLSTEDLDVIDLLVSLGADLHSRTEINISVLHLSGNNKTVLEKILSIAKEKNQLQELVQNDALLGAVESSNMECVKLLISHGASVHWNEDEHEYTDSTFLHIASREGRLDIVEYLVDKGANINVFDEEGNSVVFVAVSEGYLDIVKYLVEKGANVTEQCFGNTPLHEAAITGNLEIVQYLVSIGANINIEDYNHNSVLMVAAEAGHLHIVNYIVENVANAYENNYGILALQIAASNGYRDIVKCLLNNGLNVNDKDNDSKSVLHVAASNGHLEIVKYLVEVGANVNDKDNDGSSILHKAASCGHLDIVQYLVELCANVNNQQNDNQSVVQVDDGNGHVDRVKCVVKHGANVNDKDNIGRSVLHAAASKSNINIVKYLVEINANVNDKDKYGRSVLHVAGWKGHLDAVKCLLKLGANVNDKDKYNQSVLYVVASRGHIDVVDHLLNHGAHFYDKDNDGWLVLIMADNRFDMNTSKHYIEFGANVNDKDGNGRSVLHVAASKGHLDTVQQLVKRGANINVKDNMGRSVLQEAVSKGHIDIVKCLVELGADVNSKDNMGWLVLVMSSKRVDVVTTKYLVEHGANVNDKNKDGRSVLHEVVSQGHLDIVKYLLELGANVNEKDKDGMSVLHVAARSGNLDIVKYLLENGANFKDKDNDGRLVEFGSNVNDRDNTGRAVLHEICFIDAGATLEYLVKHGASVNDKDKDGRSVIHVAAASWDGLDALKYLVENGSKVNDRDNDGRSVLHEAAASFHYLDKVKYLVEHGANINDKDNAGRSILHVVASEWNFLDRVKCFVKHGANVNDKDKYGNSVLYLAANEIHLDVIKYLLNLDPNDTVDNNVYSDLYQAAEKGQLDTVKYMIEHDENINEKDVWSLMYFAASEGHLEIVKCLLEHGANVNGKDNDGGSVVYVAARNRQVDTVKYLVQHGANVNDKDNYGRSVLHAASSYRHLDIVKFLVDHDANVNNKDVDGRSIMHDASINGITDTVKYLVELGVNVNDKDSYGKSVLHLAASNNNLNIVKLLVENGANVNDKDNDDMSVLQVSRCNVEEYIFANGAML